MSTTKRDGRGRLRFTHNGIRFEINNVNVLRNYERYTPFQDAERAKGLDISKLDYFGRVKLTEAIRTARGESNPF